MIFVKWIAGIAGASGEICKGVALCIAIVFSSSKCRATIWAVVRWINCVRRPSRREMVRPIFNGEKTDIVVAVAKVDIVAKRRTGR